MMKKYAVSMPLFLPEASVPRHYIMMLPIVLQPMYNVCVAFLTD